MLVLAAGIDGREVRVVELHEGLSALLKTLTRSGIRLRPDSQPRSSACLPLTYTILKAATIAASELENLKLRKLRSQLF